MQKKGMHAITLKLVSTGVPAFGELVLVYCMPFFHGISRASPSSKHASAVPLLLGAMKERGRIVS
jgi:hypothetical protein